MNDDRYLRSIKEMDDEAAEVKIHHISRWLLRTIFDNLYAENDEKLCVQIGESSETLNHTDYKFLQQDLITLGEDKDELFRTLFDERETTDKSAV